MTATLHATNGDSRLRDPGHITLRQIGEHVGIAHFGGLGELSSRRGSRWRWDDAVERLV